MREWFHITQMRQVLVALAALCCLMAFAQTPAAIGDDYYYPGGSGGAAPNWDTTTNWFLGSPTGASTAWVDNSAVPNTAWIGYLGTGGTSNSYYDGETPVPINLSNDVHVQAINFGQTAADSGRSAYSLTGNSITIGDGANPATINLDMGTVAYSAYSKIASNISVKPVGGVQELDVNAINVHSGSYATTNMVFSGTNTFTKLVVSDAPGIANNIAARNFVDFTSAAASNNCDVVLGNGAGVCSMANDFQNVNIHNVTIANGGVYFPGDYGKLGNYLVVLGAGEHYNPAGQQVGQLTVTGAINGNGDVVFCADAAANGGVGTVVLNGQSHYTGRTYMLQYGSRNNAGADLSQSIPFVRLGVDNALPITTDLIYGYRQSATTGSGNSGCLDLNGHNQQLNSIGTISYVYTNGTVNDYHDGLTNTGAALSTLSICNTQPNVVNTRFDAVIGVIPFQGTPAQRAASTDNIALHLLAGNNGTLTLGLAYQAGSVPWTNANTYSGGTTIDGGYLFAANGSVGSATGTGPVTVNNTGVLGGSSSGGSVGWAGSGAVTVNAGGTLLPGGGTLDNANGFQATSGPALNVRGDLTLNAGAKVNFNFDSNHLDTVNVAGALTLPPVVGQNQPTVTIFVNDAGTLQNGEPLFTFGSLTNAFASSVFTIGGGSTPAPQGFAYSFAEVGNQIELLAPWKGSYKVWTGANSGVWDVGVTSNFNLTGAPITFSNNDVVVFGNTATNTNVTIDAGGVTPGAPLTFANSTLTYTIGGGSIGDGAGQVVLIVSGGGKVILNNTNTYSGTTNISNHSTLSIATAGAVGGTSFVNLTDTSTLQFGSSMTGANAFAKNIEFYDGSAGAGASPVLDTQGYDVEITGTMNSYFDSQISILTGFTKMGSGTLTLSNPNFTNNAYGGITKILGGAIRLNSVVTAPGQSYSALYASSYQIYNGGTLFLDHIGIGVAHNDTTVGAVGFVDLFNGSTLKGAGNAWYDVGSVSPTMNYNNGVYTPGIVTFATGTDATDTLSIKTAVSQFDPNYSASHYGNWDPATRQNDPTKLITLHVTGAGRVVLQSGNTSSNTTFGGEWSVDNGTLQVGPFVPNPNPVSGTTQPSDWSGPNGQPLNALGFKTPSGQGNSSYGDPDLPNGVTVHAGGTLAIAVDQVNTNPNGAGVGYNGTPDYLRNPITLAGGSVAATGSEVDFGTNTTDPQGVPNGTSVVARLGGNFTVNPGVSKVLVYNPVITGDTGFTAGPRTVSLVEGARTLTNLDSWWSSIAGGQSTFTIQYTTTWNGTLEVAAQDQNGTYQPGVFMIARNAGAGPVTVGTGASAGKIQIDQGATVDVTGTGDALNDLAHHTSVAFQGDGTGLGHLVIDRPADLTFAGTIGGTLDLTLPSTNSGTVTLSGALSYTGNTTVNGGTLIVGDLTTSPTIAVTQDAIMNANSLQCDTLTIGGPAQGMPLTGTTAPVPEPETLVLLSLALTSGVIAFHCRRNRC